MDTLAGRAPPRTSRFNNPRRVKRAAVSRQSEERAAERRANVGVTRAASSNDTNPIPGLAAPPWLPGAAVPPPSDIKRGDPRPTLHLSRQNSAEGVNSPVKAKWCELHQTS